MRHIKRLLPLLLTLLLLFSGCEMDSSPGGSDAPSSSASQDGGFVPYKAPPMAKAEFHPDLAEGNEEAQIDASAVSEGYVAAVGNSDKRLKFQVITDELTYTYDLLPDGTPSAFPLQSGNGHYTFRVAKNVAESKYAVICSVECDVKLIDEFQPFLRPSDYSRYDEQSECVKKAAQLAKSCSTSLEVVSAVYDFVCDNIKYDYEKAETVQSGYLPDVDETLATKKGICFDYASLAAAMLRSQGIPTKIIFGYVEPDSVYHAWNMFYTKESGWVTVSFEVNGKVWTRVDMTFSAGGVPPEFIGDGTNYTDVYSY